VKDCPICKHSDREKIERVLFKVGPDDASLTLEKIAEEFEVNVEDLRRHSLFHTPYGSDGTDSIVRRLKIHEADLLGEAAQEYAVTLKQVGKRIRGSMNRGEAGDDPTFEKCLTKPVADLYLGCGDTLQKTVKAIADIDHLLNGPKDDGLSGLTTLANALQASRQAFSPVTTNDSGEDADSEA
jgi:hypothetical protein